MTDVLIVCDEQGRIQQVNTALEALTDRCEADLIGQTLSSLCVQESRMLVDGFLDKIRSDAVHDCEITLCSADGRPAPLAMNCTSRYDQRGRLVGMVLIGRPVGELRRAYQALNTAHQELQQVQQQLVQSEKMASLARLPQVAPDFVDIAGLAAGKCLISRDGTGEKCL